MSTPPKTTITDADPGTDSKLPEGWVSIILQDHIYIAGRIGWRGLKAEEYTRTGPILVSVPNLNHGDLVDFGAVDHISVGRYEESPEIQLRSGDVLLVKDGAGIGKIGYVGELPGDATVNSSLLVIRPGDALLFPKYLFYFLKGPEFQSIALNRITGSATPHLFQKDIKLFPILVPPPIEQRRIATEIEHCLKRVSKLRRTLLRAPAILKRFRQAVLAAACSGELTEDWRTQHPEIDSAAALIDRSRVELGRSENDEFATAIADLELAGIPESWTWAPTAHIGSIRGGIQKQPKRMPKKNAYPYLRVANVLRDRLDLTEMQYMELFDSELQTYRLAAGDLLIVEGNGSLSEIGRSAIWNGAIENCVHQNHIIRVRLSRCVPEFVNAYWNSPLGIASIAQVAVTTAGLYSLSTKKIAQIPVPVPPVKEQEEIVRRVEALLKLADAIEKRVAAATLRAERLTQAILAKAFRGELVPTEAELARRAGRDYDPASVLLERIRAERAKNTEDAAKQRPKLKRKKAVAY